ncbi:mannose-6-phosphate isomerase class I [Vibrio ponticus]|nr:mannose-6-phosphate isomerase class I [Vibrio ponticus]
MKQVCDLDPSKANYAWCFDCVPEENSLKLKVDDVIVEIPSQDLVLLQPKALLGDKVHARFGAEFPIRFDFLDTMEGQHLSLQVHPLTEYIQNEFGMHYTQDESYYILDAGEDASVYLGVKNGIDRQAMLDDLAAAQRGEKSFDDERFINKFPAKKHDHFLIPAGTIHCSGSNAMVLEVSATPYIFTFKLWDWDRVGLDGLPRPVHLQHGEKVIQWDRDTDWVQENLINRIDHIDQGEGWSEERTGLHEREFIETRRHWFSDIVTHDTQGLVNVLNLIEGREATVESPTGQFEPFIVHYAETFVIPANVGAYTIRPTGESEGKQIATLKAFVRV